MSRIIRFLTSSRDRATVALIARCAEFDRQVSLASDIVSPMAASS